MPTPTNYLNLVRRPAFRKLRAYSFDPSLSLRMDTAQVNDLTYKVAWEALTPGPVGEYLEVIDYDPTVGKFYKPVDLNDRYVLAQDGLDPSEGHPQFHQQMVYAVAMTTIAHFEKALGRKVLWAPRRLAYGQTPTHEYEEFVPRLRLYPHALRDANAFYSPLKKAVLFGYFSSAPADETLLMPDSLVFTCLSHDIIAHEVTHAILDGMHSYYNEPTNADVLAFHEAFADIVALFQHFTFPEVLKHQIARTRGDLASQNLLGELAQQMGTAIGGYGSLRDAIGQRDPATGEWQPKVPSADDYRLVMEPHARGAILVAAVFEAFLAIYKSRITDLLRIASGGSGVLPQGELHPDLVGRLAAEAAKAASHVLSMCIRALDYCPPVDITFGEYLRAIITADVDAVLDDQRDYRLAFIDAFRRRGIYPTGIKTLSVDSLRFKVWNIGAAGAAEKLLAEAAGQQWANADGADAETQALFDNINTFLRKYAEAIKYVSDRAAIYRMTKDFILIVRGDANKTTSRNYGLYNRKAIGYSKSRDFARITGLVFLPEANKLGVRKSDKHERPSFQIQNLRLVNRVGPDGTQINQVVFSIVQRSGIVAKRNPKTRAVEFGHYVPVAGKEVAPRGPQEQRFDFRGGCTLIFDLDTQRLKYAISKPLLDVQALSGPAGAAKIDEARLRRQYDYLYGEAGAGHNDYALYFGEQLHHLSEPFAFLHQH